MKILFVNKFEYFDYLNDMIYHGLIDKGEDVYETSYPSYMLKSVFDMTSVRFKKFSLYGKLEHSPKVENQSVIIEKIKDKFYDVVIFGSVHRDLSYLDAVIKSYSKDEIYFIDGEDETDILEHLISYGIYYKRECTSHMVKPISFSIPESQLLNNKVNKERMFGSVIPGRFSSYIFDNEKDYYQDYSVSYYGITHKKGGWDCMRHYEILANRCIPFFIDLNDCPSLTLFNFPKDIILECNGYAKNIMVHPNYDMLNNQLFDYVKNNLTTKKVVDYLFN